MTVYISGPITGNPDAEAQFEAAAAMIENAGHNYINPAKLVEVMPSIGYSQAILVDLFIELWADAICLLPGWENSKGSRVERAWAINEGLQVLTLKDFQ